MVKKIITGILMISIILIAFAGCGKKDVYNAGTYEGVGKGHGGDIKVSVTVSKTKIESIKVTENHESDFGQPIINRILERAVKQNSAEMDTIAGATETSKGLLAAIKDALSKAYAAGGATAVKKSGKTETKSLPDVTVDVVIVGSGGAGLSAAVEAHDNGSKVLVLEKMAVVGGNTNYATGGLNAAETSVQKQKGIQDTKQSFIDDTMKGGKNINNPELVKVLADKGADTVDWLIALGADLSDVGRLAGATNQRAHRPTGGAAVGSHLVKVLKAAVESRKIEIRTENKVIEILHDNNIVKGVKVQTPDGTYNVNAKAVVIATGGFGANPDLLVKYQPSLKGFGTTNHPGATGDAIDLVTPLNVAFVDMKEIQTHPTVVPVKNEMITEAVRGNGAILVNRSGKRFINELETRDVVSEATLKQDQKTAFLVFDKGVRDSLKAIEDYIKGGYVLEGATIEEVAKKANIDGAALAETVKKYDSFVSAKKDSDYGRADLPRKLDKGPYYMIEVGPAVHHTMGGIKIDTNTEVLDNNGKVVSGLFAAGEVTGGVHGANRLGGNAVADITVFGRIAGKQAAAFSK